MFPLEVVVDHEVDRLHQLEYPIEKPQGGAGQHPPHEIVHAKRLLEHLDTQLAQQDDTPAGNLHNPLEPGERAWWGAVGVARRV